MRKLLTLVLLLVAFHSFGRPPSNPSRPFLPPDFFSRVTLTEVLPLQPLRDTLPQDSIPQDTIPQDTIIHDTIPPCYSSAEMYVDCDKSFCIRFKNPCRDTCMCVAIYFTDGTVVNENLQIPGSSVMKICFDKEIHTFATIRSECPKCGIGRPSGRQAALPARSTQAPMLYPNPVKNRLTVRSLTDLKGVSVVITDITGRMLSKNRLLHPEIDMSNLGAGTYLIQLYRGEKLLTVQKIVK